MQMDELFSFAKYLLSLFLFLSLSSLNRLSSDSIIETAQVRSLGPTPRRINHPPNDMTRLAICVDDQADDSDDDDVEESSSL